MTKNEIIEHYKKMFDLHAKGIALDNMDHLVLAWAETLVKDLGLLDVSNNEVEYCECLAPIIRTGSDNGYCANCGNDLR